MDSTLHYAQEFNEANISLKSPMFESATHGLMGHVHERRGDDGLAELHMARSNTISDSVRSLFGKVEANGDIFITCSGSNVLLKPGARPWD